MKNEDRIMDETGQYFLPIERVFKAIQCTCENKTDIDEFCQGRRPLCRIDAGEWVVDYGEKFGNMICLSDKDFKRDFCLAEQRWGAYDTENSVWCSSSWEALSPVGWIEDAVFPFRNQDECKEQILLSNACGREKIEMRTKWFKKGEQPCSK